MKKRNHERAFIEQLRASFRPSSGQLRLGIGDDAAVFRPSPHCEQLYTSDLLVENVHFDLATSSPWQLGAKAVAASLSDIAAMGGLPKAWLVSLAVPKRRQLNPSFFKSFYDGMRIWGGAFGAQLAGGDTTSSPGPLVIDIFMIGEVEQGSSLRRSGARPGDYIYCSGNPGDSAAGLALLQKKYKKPDKSAAILLMKKHLQPLPRILAGRFLNTHRAASACIDISDGLASELHHLARESRVGMDIEADAIPLSSSARMLSPRALQWALNGGEDYELLFTVAPKKASMLEKDCTRMTGTPIRRIGTVRRGSGVRIRIKGTWKALADSGYEHKIF